MILLVESETKYVKIKRHPPMFAFVWSPSSKKVCIPYGSPFRRKSRLLPPSLHVVLSFWVSGLTRVTGY